MRILAVHPGASHSTADVYAGLVGALTAQGHEITPYPLDVRIGRADGWLAYSWRRARKHEPDIIRPSWADALYEASKHVIYHALRMKAQGALDGVLVVSGMYLHPDILVILRTAGIRTAMLLTESPYDVEHEAKVVQYVDVAWTNERSCVDYLRQYNPNTHYLPHAHDPARHSPEPNQHDADVPAHDVVFVGTAFQERIELLEQVDWDGIDFGLYGAWEALPSRHKLRKHLVGRIVENDVTAALYRRAKIGLNLYRTSKGFGRRAPRISHAESLNPRAYELAACGVFQLSDWRREAEEVFGGCVPTFSSAEELQNLLTTFLRYPHAEQDRRNYALSAQQRVRPHTFDARARQLVEQLEAAWNPPGIRQIYARVAVS